MKNLYLFFALLIAVGTLDAQSTKFNDAMTKVLADFDTVKTADGMMSLANTFERIALAEKNQWLPFYYSALARTTASFIYNDITRFDPILDMAEKHAKTADSLSPNNSEILVLRSMIFGGRIMVDPASRGQLYGMQSMMLLQQAMVADPVNPRAYLVMGQSLLFTPPQFGGGKEPGCKTLQSSKEMFTKFSPASPLHPDWGEEQVDQLLLQCAAQDPGTGKED